MGRVGSVDGKDARAAEKHAFSRKGLRVDRKDHGLVLVHG